jgi:hypothetical protein
VNIEVLDAEIWTKIGACIADLSTARTKVDVTAPPNPCVTSGYGAVNRRPLAVNLPSST